ncbi:hypothetical protein CVT26_000139 [Gymnopilus dilepis]|uniref:Uncharacterized protein n=1 Tax=Gymnopilus dilepis TaxID=231916 RepID=A0A409VGW5_9AGAR|nr:hypothetical protein CVT26_000139 [Gymnopilus dilepis]
MPILKSTSLDRTCQPIARSITAHHVVAEELPPTVESIQKSWLYTLRTGALISGLLAIVAALLLVFKADTTSTSAHSSKALSTASVIFAYVPLFLNASACMSCFILVDRLGELPYHAARKPQLPRGGSVTLHQQGILKLYGIGGLWPWIVWHWLFCFTFGAWSIFAEVLLYIWLHDSKEVRIVLASLAGFCFLPFLAFILAPVFNVLVKLSSGPHSQDDRSLSATSPDIESIASPSPVRGTSPMAIAGSPHNSIRHSSNIRFPSSSPHRPNHRDSLQDLKSRESPKLAQSPRHSRHFP